MKNLTFWLVKVSLILVFFSACKTPKHLNTLPNPTDLIKFDTLKIGFYNVENLFDTLDDPNIVDEEFLPNGTLKWNTARYQKKLADLAKVINAMGAPSVLGVCEIENYRVLSDLTTHPDLLKHNYRIEHLESPDERGIDVALLYKSTDFQPIAKNIIRLSFPTTIAEPGYTSRDVLMVRGKLKGKKEVVFFVNHWPSRREGQAVSEPKRVFVAQKLRQAVDSIFALKKNTAAVIMGDFNDEPNNNSILKTLAAQPLDSLANAEKLYNLFYAIQQSGGGSYNYRGAWNTLDQIIVSGNFLQFLNGVHFQNAKPFREEWMMYNDPKFGLTPNRTYGGPNYYGGYSDHLPVVTDVVILR